MTFPSFDMSIVQISLLSIAVAAFIIQAIFYLWIYLKPVLRSKGGRKKQSESSLPSPGVSVIVYAHNNSEELANNLPSILNQDYPNFEVIVVNDGSSEESQDVLLSIEKQHPNLYHTFLAEGARNLSRRKLSITLGIKAAKHDILLFTNAWCKPSGDKWISNMVRNFDHKTEIVIGHSNIIQCSNDSYIAFDMLQDSVRTLGYTMAISPFSADGCNLAYRKDVFFSHKGFAKHIKLHLGDDDLFINEVATSSNTKVELSEQSTMVADYSNNIQGWSCVKKGRAFTSQFYRTMPKLTFRFDTITRYLLVGSAIATSAMWSTNHLFSYISAGIFVLYYILLGAFWHNAGKQLSNRSFFFLSPLFVILTPLTNTFFRLHNKLFGKRNYTWHYSNQ